MNPLNLSADQLRTFITGVALAQFIGAVLTFRSLPNRRRGGANLAVLAYIVVLAGTGASDLLEPATILGSLGLLTALGLFLWARITIQGNFFSYINSTDTPQFLCASGPFHYIRHPFYSSYLLTLLSATVLFPNPITAIGTVLAAFAFNSAAHFEEQKFKSSPVAADYEAYLHRTGRFFPHLR